MAFILGPPPIPQLGVQPTWRYSTTMDSQRTVDEMLAANFRIFADLKGSALLSTDPKIHKISKMRKYIYFVKNSSILKQSMFQHIFQIFIFHIFHILHILEDLTQYLFYLYNYHISYISYFVCKPFEALCQFPRVLARVPHSRDTLFGCESRSRRVRAGADKPFRCGLRRRVTDTASRPIYPHCRSVASSVVPADKSCWMAPWRDHGTIAPKGSQK
jgi:hypothetical protein